ncbi:MAG: hypothetical protein NUV98_00560 [Candidatus Roizmanbacteria bacterium]|nr:hypothetical protein [Candidatus Roizmanbacteria bacterium]
MTKRVKERALFVTGIGLFIFFSIWFLCLHFFQIDSSNVIFQAYGALYGIVALFGAVAGLYISSKWGGIQSIFGRSIFFLSLGLLFQELGQLAYSFYVVFLHVEVPYPSIGDIGYFGSIPFYIYGTVLLAHASGVRINVKAFKNRPLALLIPLAMLGTSYFFFLSDYEIDWSFPLVTLLDFGYPLGQAVYVSLAFLTYLLSQNVLGGVMKNKVFFILLALFAQYIADWTFLYQASREIWYAGGINDYMYLIAYFLMTIGLIQLNTVVDGVRNSKS